MYSECADAPVYRRPARRFRFNYCCFTKNTSLTLVKKKKKERNIAVVR